MYNSPWNSDAITSHIHNILSNLLSKYKILWSFFPRPLFLTYNMAGLITDMKYAILFQRTDRNMQYYTFFGDLLCTYNWH